MEIEGSVHINQAAAFKGQENPVPKKMEDLQNASQQFEAIFLRNFLGTALKPLLHSTPGSSGPGAGFYEYMMTDVLSTTLAQQQQFGFASLLQMELGGRMNPEAEQNNNQFENLKEEKSDDYS